MFLHFADEPGKTDVIEHDIWVKNSMPVIQPAYRIPYAYKEEVRKEMREMLEAEIICIIEEWMGITYSTCEKGQTP